MAWQLLSIEISSEFKELSGKCTDHAEGKDLLSIIFAISCHTHPTEKVGRHVVPSAWLYAIMLVLGYHGDK